KKDINIIVKAEKKDNTPKSSSSSSKKPSSSSNNKSSDTVRVPSNKDSYIEFRDGNNSAWDFLIDNVPSDWYE
ncbi:MAG: hypothetical protein ACLRNS_12070, partial [Coprobacillus cateniformis]